QHGTRPGAHRDAAQLLRPVDRAQHDVVGRDEVLGVGPAGCLVGDGDLPGRDRVRSGRCVRWPDASGPHVRGVARHGNSRRSPPVDATTDAPDEGDPAPVRTSRPHADAPDTTAPPAPEPVPGAAPDSWEKIVAEHSARVYRLAYRLTGNRHDAEDLTQETFVRVFRSLDGYTPGTFEGWTHRITTNLFLDQARRRSRVRM